MIVFFAERPLTQYDLYVSTLVPIRDLDKFDPRKIDSKVANPKEPLCSTKEILHINIKSIDSIKSIAERKSLVMQGEIGLISIILDDGHIKLSHFGNYIAQLLNKSKTSWSAYNLAALYWRMKGNAYESIECLRRALHFGPTQEAKPITLVSLGNVLHQSQRPEDAAIVLEMAIDFEPLNSVAHYTLGNVYAVLMQYNKSVESFDYALRLSDNLPWVRKRRAAVLCHQKLEKSLENQHEKLQNTLDELRMYQIQHAEWTKMNNKLSNVQASLETRVSSRASYEKFKVMTKGETFRPQGCYETIENGKIFIECVVNSNDSNNLPKQTVYRRNTPTSNEQNENLEVKVTLSNKKDSNANADDIEIVFGPENMPNDYVEIDRNQPYIKKKYPKLSKQLFNEFKKIGNPNWPSQEECKKYVSRFPEWGQLPTVYLPPENKGYDIQRIINEDIDLDSSTPHSLPWYPPVCDGDISDSVKLQPKYANMPGLKNPGTKEKYPDESIRVKFLESFGQKEEKENIAELGARIKSAMEAQIWPTWLLNTLAANYWRIIGNAGASISCYSLALNEAPIQYKDLVLTNLGALLYRLGHVDSALKLLQEAVAICDTEPETHFFLANLFSAKGNMTGAIHHYRAALKLEPEYPGGLDQLRIPSCYIKFHQTFPPSQDPGDLSCLRKDQGVKCGHPHQQERDERSCAFSNAADMHRKHEQNTLTSIQGTSDYILCRDGHCQFVTQDELDRMNHLERQQDIHACSNQENTDELVMIKPIPEEEDKITKIVHQDDMKHLPTGAVEIATIAVTEDDASDIINPNLQDVPDDELPDMLLKVTPANNFKMPVATPEKCAEIEINWKTFTSTWLSVSAKNINFGEFLPGVMTGNEFVEPECEDTRVSLRSLDHLSGVRLRKNLRYNAEVGLKEAFQSITGKVDAPVKDGVQKMATRIAQAMMKNPDSWVLSTAAALYWRVKGNAVKAINCVRHSLLHAPNNMRDIPLISLANILHRSGLYNDALIAANMALEISPTFVVSHFTMANIYTSKRDLEKAKLFYLSTLTLQSTFEPAMDRLLSVMCGKWTSK